MEDKSLDYIRNLINEVKEELNSKKVIAENKTPQEVFKKHEENIKEYVANRVFESLKQAEK